MIIFLLLFGIAMIVSGIFMTLCGRKMRDILTEMEKKGTIFSGTQKGLLFVKTYNVFMSVDKKGIVKDAKLLITGFLYPGKIKELPVTGRNIRTLSNNTEGMDMYTAGACKSAARRFILKHA